MRDREVNYQVSSIIWINSAYYIKSALIIVGFWIILLTLICFMLDIENEQRREEVKYDAESELIIDLTKRGEWDKQRQIH